MNSIAQFLVVVGFCLGTLGAAGFGDTVEPAAWPLIIAGIGGLAAGGMLQRRTAKAGAAEEDRGEGSPSAQFEAALAAVGAGVAELAEAAGSQPAGETREQIDLLLGGAYFDLTSRNEEWMSLLGFSDYAAVWDGVAGCERRLSRCWSLITDGFPEEGLLELPGALERIETAIAAAQSTSAAPVVPQA